MWLIGGSSFLNIFLVTMVNGPRKVEITNIQTSLSWRICFKGFSIFFNNNDDRFLSLAFDLTSHQSNHQRWRCYQNRKVPSSNHTVRSAGHRELTLLRGSRWPQGQIFKNAVINIRWVRLLPRQWPKVSGSQISFKKKTIVNSEMLLLQIYYWIYWFVQFKGSMVKINLRLSALLYRSRKSEHYW